MTEQDLTREQLLQQLATAQQTIAELKQTVRSMAPLPGYDALYNLLQQLPIGIQIFNVNGDCVDVNDACLKILRLPGRESQVGRYNLFSDPDARASGISRCGELALQGELVQILELQIGAAPPPEQPGAAPDTRVVRVTMVPVKDAHHHVVQLVALSEDVSEQYRAGQSAKQMEQKYQTLIEQLPAITYTVDFSKAKNRTSYISPQVEELLGYSAQEWLADPELWVRQLHPEDRATVLAEVSRCDAAGERLDIEYRVIARDGSTRWFRNKNAIIAEQGQPRLAHGIMLDITQQKKLESQLRQIQRMEAVGQMAGGMAHNFNNLLTSLIGHTELALSMVEGEHPVYPDLQAISKSATRAAELTRQLLAFTRHQQSKPTALNLSELLLENEPVLSQLVPDEFEFAVSAAPNLWLIKADPNHLEQLLVNLVVNARDALRPGGRISITTGNRQLPQAIFGGQQKIPAGNYVLLTVTDTGSGISPEVKPHIFEPFFTTKEVGQGTGLGLSTCLGIVQQSQGYITVESEAQRGTTFCIYFPAIGQPAPRPEAAAALRDAGPSPASEHAILLVDDAFIIRQMSARTLRQQGFAVLEAANGQEALTLMSESGQLRPDLLVTDVSMPVMNGVDLARQVVRQFPGIKVLFISGHSDRVLMSRGASEIAHSVLTKPFTPQLLLEAVGKLLQVKS
ncbi:MAG: hypothetical protein Kow0031_22100 [Anaerolineae bacterium]